MDRLNERYTAARAADFSVDPVTAGPGDNPTTGELQRRYDSRMRVAGGQLESGLGLEEAALRGDLDAAAEATAAVLERGATPEVVRFLAGNGAFPSWSGLVLAGWGLTTTILFRGRRGRWSSKSTYPQSMTPRTRTTMTTQWARTGCTPFR